MNKNLLIIAAAAAAYYVWSKKQAAPVPVMSTPEPQPKNTTDLLAKNAATVAPAPFSAAATALQAAGVGTLYAGAPAATQAWTTGGIEPQAATVNNAPTVDRAAIFKAQGLVEAPWAPGNYVTPAEASGYTQRNNERLANIAALDSMNLFH